jgi:SAM-dependent methyltransferase
MMADDLDRFRHERRAADDAYNDALTELDRAIIAIGDRPVERDDVNRLATALIVFLQQITPFVDTKDRELTSELMARADRIERQLEPIAEMRTQIAVVQRALQGLRRDNSDQSSVGSRQSSVISRQSPVGSRQSSVGGHPSPLGRQPAAISSDDLTYVAFEDEFRGSDETIHERLRAYVPIFAGASDVLDLGCGRGELLAALKQAGIRARGVDANAEMAGAARDRGLDAVQGDALTYLTGLGDASLGGLIATQVVEHLEPGYLMQLLAVAADKLRPAAPIVIETINAACWLAFFSSYIRDITHVRPLHPETLQFLLRASGFERVEIQYSAPVPEHMKMKTIDLPADVLASRDASSVVLAQIAHTINANAVILNNLMFTHLDYAAIGYRT